MKLELNTLYWKNTSKALVDAHQSVIDHFNVPVTYYEEDIPHGIWMDLVCKESNADIIGFLDIDCVPLSKEAILDAATYAANNNTFIGPAQASNHIHPKSHIFASPAFFFITKECWKDLETSFKETRRSDVAEEVSYVAEARGKRYRCIYPTHFEREPVEGVWRLGSYGLYGIGTVYNNYCYHLYQGRLDTNTALFVQTCQEIVDGVFNTNNLHVSIDFNYKGRIVA